MLNSALEAAIMERTPIWAAGAQDWWDFTRSGRAKRGVDAMPVETRASDGWVENEAGVWVRRSPNTRSMAGKGLLTYPGRVNQIKNAGAAGGTAGIVGSGAVYPTGWSAGGSDYSSVTRTISFGTRNGLSGMYVRYQAVASGALQFAFEKFAGIADAALAGGYTHTVSCFAEVTEVAAGTPANLRYYFNTPEYNSSDVFVTERFGTVSNAPLTWRRISDRWTVNASTAKGEIRIRWGVSAAGTYDFTVFVAWPQLELGSFATPPIADASATTTDTAAGPQQVIDIGSRAALGVGFIIDATVLETTSTLSRLIEISDGTGNNVVNAYMVSASNKLVFGVASGGVASVTMDVTTPALATGRMVVAGVAGENYAVARVVGQSAPTPETTVTFPTTLSKVNLLGRGSDAARNSYGYAKRLALWYGPMSAHFFDNVLWPKAQLLAQQAA